MEDIIKNIIPTEYIDKVYKSEEKIKNFIDEIN